ncbi:MAG: beta-galactosidase trimerization domain-containing protein [Victivallales bacterium]|jgi:hypothetical protein|nr:beta-galactosidase trimerization domain-containing protein [Victivallales bacterium]
MRKIHKVNIGGMSESGYGSQTVELMNREKLGNYTVLFAGPWTPQALAQLADTCRKNGFRFVMDEMISRLSGSLTDKYQLCADEIVQILNKNRDICDGSLLMCEYGGLMFYWPQSTVEGALTLPTPSETFSEAAAKVEEQMRQSIKYAESCGIPRPYICIEASGAAAPFICRAGIDRIDYEVTYNSETELSYSMIKGASLSFGKPAFGVDMAMVWYGGNQHDMLWQKRWRTSLLHAYIRGADPIYAEHGVMDYKALGKNYNTNHPDVAAFRKPLAEIAEIAGKYPRPEGFPLAEIAVMQGRLDGFAGLGQTHQWGQRLNDQFRCSDAERSWKLFNCFYQRHGWENRERYGDHDYSGNPPFGQVDVIAFDAPQKIVNRYKAIVFLGRNVMDDALYEKLTAYVEQGGELLMCSAHMDTAERPGATFTPFRNGDWRELFGVSAGQVTRLPYGVKFLENPPQTAWQLPLWSENCDPKFTDGGFDMLNLQLHTAKVLAVGSDRFVGIGTGETAITANPLGKGCAVLVNSLAFPGADALENLYTMLLNSCVEAHHDKLRVEASDRVRYAVYRDEKEFVLYLLNTEEYLPGHVIVQDNELTLLPGELKMIRLNEKEVR